MHLPLNSCKFLVQLCIDLCVNVCKQTRRSGVQNGTANEEDPRWDWEDPAFARPGPDRVIVQTRDAGALQWRVAALTVLQCGDIRVLRF